MCEHLYNVCIEHHITHGSASLDLFTNVALCAYLTPLTAYILAPSAHIANGRERERDLDPQAITIIHLIVALPLIDDTFPQLSAIKAWHQEAKL